MRTTERFIIKVNTHDLSTHSNAFDVLAATLSFRFRQWRFTPTFSPSFNAQHLSPVSFSHPASQSPVSPVPSTIPMGRGRSRLALRICSTNNMSSLGDTLRKGEKNTCSFTGVEVMLKRLIPYPGQLSSPPFGPGSHPAIVMPNADSSSFRLLLGFLSFFLGDQANNNTMWPMI